MFQIFQRHWTNLKQRLWHSSAVGKVVAYSETRLDDFWKFFAKKILAKEAQMIVNFLGYFEKPHSYVKTALGNVWKN